MAYQKKKLNVSDIAEEKEIIDEVKETEEIKVSPTPRKYEKDETIPCKSITNGLLLITGDKSGILYRWADYGHIEDIEYQDLIYMIKAHKSGVFKPRFIIQDDEFIAQHPELEELYTSLYSMQDLADILALPVGQMKAVIMELPKGAFEAIKGVAGSMISSGRYDSVRKIKVLDEIFDTQLLLTLAQS